MAAGADLPAAPAPAEPARVEPAAQAAAAVDPAAASTTESLPMLRDLPAEDRAALPPLKLSMHVYAVHPAERFVLVDGRRYSEGMAVANGLVLEEIRRDGVVLAFRGHRFVLQRPG